MKIMIVDDSRKMRDMIKRVLLRQLKNIDSIIECGDGRQAIIAYNVYKPDFVLMDIEMEPMNGLSATIKIIDQYPDAKIVIVTQYNEPEFREAANNAGAHAYVLKENLFDLAVILNCNS